MKPNQSLDVNNVAVPPVCRLTSIARQGVGGVFRMSAELCFGQHVFPVSWQCSHPDVRLRPGVLVSPRYLVSSGSAVGKRISRIVLLDRPERSVNLFETIPASWVRDGNLVARAVSIWEGLPLCFRELINTLLWDGGRMRRFCLGPGSMRGHHAEVSGNFRHAVETAEAMLALLPRFPTADASVVVAAGFLHDVAKSDDYQPQGGNWSLTDWGRLVAHRNTLLLWLGEALGKLRCPLSDQQQLALLHALTATRGAPPWTGLRSPLSAEATMLSLADRASGRGDLMARLQGGESGWGASHPHLEGQSPYAINVSAQGGKTLPGMQALLAAIREGRFPGKVSRRA